MGTPIPFGTRVWKSCIYDDMVKKWPHVRGGSKVKKREFMEDKDYYQILGVDRNAEQMEIRNAYRKLAFQYHPDRNQGDPAAASMMKAINESYAVLSDPKKRREYDVLRQTHGASAYNRFRQTYSEHDIFSGSDIYRIFQELTKAFGLRGFEEVFKETYGPQYRSFSFQSSQRRGRGIFTFASGQSRPIGNSMVGAHLGRLIRRALEKTWGIQFPETGKHLQDRITLSPSVARTGGKIHYRCRKNNKDLIVNIPPGIKTDQQIRLKGMGGEGRGGGKPGDLFVKIRVRSRFLQALKDTLTQPRQKKPGHGA
jgi:curved DNA-binding protein CbpA